MNPRVSVVIAAKNEELHVEETVRSILDQKGVSYELVFVDDHSTDRTIERVKEVSAGFDNLRLELNPGRGKVAAFNHGVSIARGDWVCLFAGDDIMPAGSLAKRWQAVKDVSSPRPVVGLCRLITMSEVKSQDGHVVPRNPNEGGMTGVSYLMDHRARQMMFPVPLALPNEDTWLEMTVRYFDFEIVHSGVIGTQWRVHAGNSINMLVPYQDFNQRYTIRMVAAALFLERHGHQLPARHRASLLARVECEEGRKNGDLWRVMTSKVPIVDRLRAASLSNRFLYDIRRKLYGLLSGW